MYKTHQQTEDIIYNSDYKRAKRAKLYAFLFLAFTAFILGFSRYNASQAQEYKAKALQQQQVERLSVNSDVNKAIAYLNGVKALTNKYNQ